MAVWGGNMLQNSVRRIESKNKYVCIWTVETLIHWRLTVVITWRGWGKPQRLSWQQVSRPRFEPSTSRIHVYSIASRPACSILRCLYNFIEQGFLLFRSGNVPYELGNSLWAWQFLFLSRIRDIRQSGSFFFNLHSGGWNQGPLDTAATQWPIVSAPGDYDNGEIGGMIGRGNRSTWRKPAPVPLCPPQTPHAARTRTRAAAVGIQRQSGS
jgi:hypothetical protein